MYGPQSASQDVPQRGRQLHREPAAPQPACGSWQAGGGPDAFAGGYTRSQSAPPTDLAERWAARHAVQEHMEPHGPQPIEWQHAGRPGHSSTHLASQVFPLLAEVPAQPSPSALLPTEQQQWLKHRLQQAQQQLARQRAEQAAWAAAAEQLLRSRAPQPAHARLPPAYEEARCPACVNGSGQDSTDSQQLEELIDSLEAEMEQRLGELQRRQRWEQAQQQAQAAAAAWDRQRQAQAAGAAWSQQQQEQERLAMLRLDQDQWQRAAAAAMQQQPPGGLPPPGQQRQQLGHSVSPGPSFAYAHGYGGADVSMAPVRLSAPARLQQHRQASFGATTADPSLLLNRAWEQQQRQRQQSWQQAQSEPPAQQRQHSWQQAQSEPPAQQRQHSWQQQQQARHQQQHMAAQQFDSVGQPWAELTRTGAQLQLEQQQWASHAREVVERSSGGAPPSWR
ncbi:hypothetical protein C2E21_0655 [Chlorella sorokiniana]|uniref:Uncharacterized protein n=1 Tax=Chlorella sorokiniana TaxID=3076 RepID=A0A2P6U5F1_CHLSO|nr:hypothetical protein C2E21_0655 [Chlorella sorokiniana]|eukprot:PRW61548.1 hypothetical protein C2E21_0655 [Chlorella sorokiniana]